MDAKDLEQVKDLVVKPEVRPLERRMDSLETRMFAVNERLQHASETVAETAVEQKSLSTNLSSEREERLKRNGENTDAHTDLYARLNALDKGVAIETTKGKFILLTSVKIAAALFGIFTAVIAALGLAAKMGWIGV